TLETSPITDAHGNYIGALAGVMDITERKKVEDELCKSEVKYRTVADYTYDWELWLDPAGRLLYCSPSCERITGYSADEFLADPNLLRSIVYPDDLEIYDRHFYEGKREDSYEHEAEFRIVRADGSVRWISHTCQSVFDDAGKYLGTRGSNRDITERKQAVEALQDSEKRYRSLFENMLDGFAYCKMLYDDQGRPVDFVYLEVNSAFERLTGLKDVIGKRATQAIPGIMEEHPELFDTYSRVALTGRPEKFEIEFKPLGIWLSISVYSTERGYFVAVFDNITDRKKSEKELHEARDELEMRVAERTMDLQKANLALRDAKDHLDMILNSIGDPVFVKDRQHRCILVNDASCKLFGHSRDDIIGRTAYELFPTKEMADISWAKDEEVFLTGVENVNEETNSYASGVTRTVLVKKTPYRDKSGNELLVGVTRDITDRKLAETELQRAKEAAEAASKTKSEFLANMSHEIRTPMNAVIGLTGLLQRTDLNEEQRDYVETIRSSGDSLLSVINDILDFSKVDSGKIELETQPFNLKDCVEDSLDLVATDASNKGLNLSYTIDTSSPGTIIGDPARLRQILINLLSNAIKFTDKGKVTVAVSSKKLEGDDHEIHFAVKDTGIGIPEDKVSRLFQPFSQVDASTTRLYGGTGLGLAISKRLVEMMGGRIWAQSEVGNGSTFHFTIQAAATTIKSASSKAIVHQLQTDLKLSQSPALRILLAEDNPVSQKVGLQMLRKIGYEADVAANGLDVLQALERQTYDIILMDVQMPEMDGLEATKRIRERWHDGPKIIAITAYALEGDRDRCLNGGMDDYISKPIQIEELQSKLMKWGTNIRRSRVPTNRH
ncbi:MAG TPA: PAS domain S-box protein, partial [Methanotrichaceae archaeon]|nr:PAS domain S-box protein [Methanotrichaceae archaeon]